jgi:hypothetical protein
MHTAVCECLYSSRLDYLLMKYSHTLKVARSPTARKSKAFFGCTQNMQTHRKSGFAVGGSSQSYQPSQYVGFAVRLHLGLGIPSSSESEVRAVMFRRIQYQKQEYEYGSQYALEGCWHSFQTSARQEAAFFYWFPGKTWKKSREIEAAEEFA